jgi:hypothetical protein
MNLPNIIIVSLSSFGLAIIISNSVIFSRLRSLFNARSFFGKFIYCTACQSFWYGSIMSLLQNPDIPSAIMVGLFCSGVSSILSAWLNDKLR